MFSEMAERNLTLEFIEREGDLLQQVALLLWLRKGGEYESLYDAVTGVKTWVEMVKHFENGESLEAIKTGLVGWLHTGFGSQGLIQECVTSTTIAEQLKKWFNKEQEIEALRQETLLAIAAYIQQNPNASEEELKAELVKRIALFASQVDLL